MILLPIRGVLFGRFRSCVVEILKPHFLQLIKCILSCELLFGRSTRTDVLLHFLMHRLHVSREMITRNRMFDLKFIQGNAGLFRFFAVCLVCLVRFAVRLTRFGLRFAWLSLRFARLGFRFTRLGLRFARLGCRSARLGFRFARLGFRFARLGFRFARLGFRSARLVHPDVLDFDRSIAGIGLRQSRRPDQEHHQQDQCASKKLFSLVKENFHSVHPFFAKSDAKYPAAGLACRRPVWPRYPHFRGERRFSPHIALRPIVSHSLPNAPSGRSTGPPAAGGADRRQAAPRAEGHLSYVNTLLSKQPEPLQPSPTASARSAASRRLTSSAMSGILLSR